MLLIDPIFETIRTSLTRYASRPGLINDVIERIDTLTCLELVNLIQSEIEDIVNNVSRPRKTLHC